MKDKLWTRGFILLTAVQTLDMFTYYMIAPVIAKYVLEQGVVVALSGLAATMFSVVSIFTRPVSGMLSDRLGRKRILIVALAVGCLAQIGYALNPSFQLLLVLRAIHGFFYALFGTAIAAMAVDSLPESRRSEGMGWFGTAYVIGAVAGPALGVYLSDTFGFQCMFLVAAVMAGLGFVLGLFLQGGKPIDAPAAQEVTDGADSDEDVGSKASRRFSVNDFVSLKCVPYALITCFFNGIWAVITTYIVIVADERSIVGAPAFFVVNSLMLFLTRPLWGKITDRRGIKSTFVPAVAFEAVTLVLLAVSQQLWLIIVAAAIKAFGSGGVLPSIQAACGKLEPKRTAVAMSTYLLGGDIGYAIGPLIGGILLDVVGEAGLFWAMLPIDALAGLVFIYLAKRNVQ